ncbi:MAG: hypothetical protein NC211_05545 [Alistipes senegalensis]|nr:hypothetical protein [Oxalobacter formigenes]MCM1281279.1 hypothetical protein [Alistipes senegalensis]
MSLSVSAQVYPSRFFSVCVLGMAALAGITGFLAVSGLAGTFSFYGSFAVFAVSLAAAFSFIFLYFREKKTFGIDISVSGQIRIREDIRDVSRQAFFGQRAALDTEGFALARGTTIWPMLLLLRLHSTTAGKRRFLIFYDSVTETEFRALYIACSWLAARQSEIGESSFD